MAMPNYPQQHPGQQYNQYQQLQQQQMTPQQQQQHQHMMQQQPNINQFPQQQQQQQPEDDFADFKSAPSSNLPTTAAATDHATVPTANQSAATNQDDFADFQVAPTTAANPAVTSQSADQTKMAAQEVIAPPADKSKGKPGLAYYVCKCR